MKFDFLNSEITEEIYVPQPNGLVKEGREYYVLKLKKILYGLKQTWRSWNAKLNVTLMNIRFVKNKNDHSVYFLNYKHDKVIISVYVDDLIIKYEIDIKVK